MRFFLAILLSVSALFSAQAATYRSDSTPIVHAKDTTLSGWSWKVFVFDVNGNKIGEGSANNAAGPSASSFDLAGTASQVTMTSDFYIAWGAAYGGLYSTGSHSGKPDWVPMGWISAYEVGGPEQQNSASGPYSGTNPQNPDGTPANPVTASPTIKSYKASIVLSCPASAVEPKLYRVVGIDNANAKIFDQVFTIMPGETRTVTVVHSSPFDLFAREVVENIAYDPELTPGSPDDPDQRYKPVGPLVTQSATPQSADPPASGNPEATNTKDSQASSAAQPAASQNTMSTAATGATSKDMSDLSKNITEELKRGTEQARVSGDATKAAIGDSNKLLKDIKDGKGGDLNSGPDMEVSSAGSLSFVAGIPGDATTLGGALTNLINATGLAAGVGTSTLIWTYEFPVLGVQTINFESYADVIASVRLFLRWCLSVLFLWQVFTIVREAFSK